MKFLLDSNAVIALMKGPSGFLTRLRQHQPRDFGISAIVAHELFYGAYRGQRTAENLARVDALQFEVLDFDREDARQAGELRALLAAAEACLRPAIRSTNWNDLAQSQGRERAHVQLQAVQVDGEAAARPGICREREVTRDVSRLPRSAPNRQQGRAGLTR